MLWRLYPYLKYFVMFLLTAFVLCMLTTCSSFVESSTSVSREEMQLLVENMQSGGLVFRRVDGAASNFLDSIDVDSPFSHVGIVYISPSPQNDVFIIHVQPEQPEHVQIQTVEDFIKDATDFAIYKPASRISDKGVVAAEQAFMWIGKRRFDREFDLDTDYELYCTELVYKAYLESGIDILGDEFNVVEFPFIHVKEVIYPSLLIKSDLFVFTYSYTN